MPYSPLLSQIEPQAHRLPIGEASGHATAGTVRVAIAHGRPSLAGHLREPLERAAGIDVVAESASGEQTVADAQRVRPDVVLMDVDLPGLDCVEATRQLHAAGTAVVLVSSGEPDHRILAALRAGAGGVLLERTRPPALVRAVLQLGRGRHLRSRRFRRGGHIQEEAMLTAKVIEIRRGSAHGGAPTAIDATAAARRRGN
jgi:DNA-binding NarL/FixJ family response regulator